MNREQCKALTEQLLADEIFAESKEFLVPIHETVLQQGLSKLIDNWDASMFHGHAFMDLVPDIDKMVEKLQAFKARALEAHQAQMSD
jgi:hypothetical protein